MWRIVWLATDAGAAEPPTLDLMWSASPDVGIGADGFAVSSAGDVNGDGFADVMVGAPSAFDGESLEGLVYVYHGSATGPVPAPSWTAQVDEIGASFGRAVAPAGDVNDDGFADVIIGAPLQDGLVSAGVAHVFLGSASGLATVPVWSVGLEQVDAGFGAAVASAGDVNNDGYGDLIVGAELFDDPDQSNGTASVFLGGPAGVAMVADWTESGEDAFDLFGASVAATDVNADTYDDVFVGAPGHASGQTGEGSATLWIGSPNGVDYEIWDDDGNQAAAAFGGAVASAGDVNGDGFGDVLVGAAGYDNPEVDEGRVFVYHGSAWGLSTTPSWSAEGDQDGAGFGGTVAGARDVNDDGYDDIVVGAAGFDGALGTDEGRVYVFFGGKTGLGDTPLEIASDQAGSRFGDVVASAGDVDGDGYDDVIVAAPQRDAGAGMTFVFAGYNPDDDLDGDGSPRPFDCDDRDETIYPGAPELCDGKDNACAGGVPDEDADLDGDGTATCAGDCDDDNAGIHPAADEVCDGADSNCDGAFDADDVDADGDAWPQCLGDCDDADPDVGPGAAEVCDDGVDNNCDGAVDEDCDTKDCSCDGSAGGAAALPALLVALVAARRRSYRTSAA